MSRAWMPLYVADYLADTGHLTNAEHGSYLMLIFHYWQRGGLPNDDERLASIAKAKLEQWLSMKATIAEFFDNEWRHSRIDAELEKSRIAYEKRALAGSKGGNSRKQCSSNAKAMLKQSQSQSQSYNINTLVKADAVDEPVSDFKKLKRARDEKNTDLIQTIAGNWNDLAAELKLPQVVHITPARQSSILRRAKELVEYYDYPDEIAGFTALFSKIRGSPFLRGETGKFRADLDFAINQSSFTKIMENRYESVKKLENTFRR